MRLLTINRVQDVRFARRLPELEDFNQAPGNNGQWDIPALRKLLEDILPHHTFFKGFEVNHSFPLIGRKIMILNARQIYFKEISSLDRFPPIIMLAMEDVTEIMAVAETLANHANRLESSLADQAKKMEARIKKLEKEIDALKGKL